MRAPLSSILLACAALGSANVAAQDTTNADSTGAVELVRQFLDAQAHYDVPALRALTSDQFVEISPLGDVDPRDRMLGFYVKDAPPARPPVGIDERQVRVFGDSAVVTVRLTLDINGQARSLRSNFVAHKQGGQWKLVSAQHTPMRPAKP